MNPWFAKAIILVGSLAIVMIPASVHRRDGRIKVVKSRKGPLEVLLLALASLGFFLPLVWVATPGLAFADHPLRPVPFFAGSFCLASGLWFVYRSHADLGANWSITLEVREEHQLVTRGVALALLFALRVGPEERMMAEEFGKDYEAYSARTKRLIPGVW